MRPKSFISVMLGMLLVSIAALTLLVRVEEREAADARLTIASLQPVGTVQTYELSKNDEDFVWDILQAAEEGNKEVIDLKVRGTYTKSTRVNVTITVRQK